MPATKDKLTLSADYVRNDLGLPHDWCDAVDIISDTIIDTSRWSIYHHLIIRYLDKFWSTTYTVGATEYQDETPWQYEKEVEFTEVFPVTKSVVVYE